MGRTCCVQKLFLTFRTISVHNLLSPCSAKSTASDKDLPVTAARNRFLSSFDILANPSAPPLHNVILSFESLTE